MRKVTAGEPMLPHFTATWFNQTIKRDIRTGLGDQSKINTGNQNIIYCVNNGEYDIDYLDPVYIKERIKPESNNALPCYCELASSTFQHWGIAQQIIKIGAVGKVTVFGLTLADVTYPERWEELDYLIKKVKFETGELVPSLHGHAEIINYDIDGLSLITIGNYEKASGKAYLPDGASPREGAALGVGFGEGVAISLDDTLVGTTENLVLYNDSLEPIKKGYVQYKEVAGKLLIDVAPCYEEDRVH